jgi:hypothetical protein
MGARLLTPDEIRGALGAKAIGLSDDDLQDVARRVRVITLELLARPAK